MIGRAEQAWRRTDVHTIHHPDALTVRARAWRHSKAVDTAAWIGRTTRPARTWLTARRRATAGWCGARWTALRVRVTGHGGPVRYQTPNVVPGQVVDHPAPGPGADVIPFPSPCAPPDDHAPHEPPADPWGDAR